MKPHDVLRRASMGAILFAMLSGVAGCFSSVHEYQAAGYASPTRREAGPPIEANRIQSDASQFVVLGVTGNTDYVDQAYASLTSQCPGEIVGINTRYSTKLGFLSYTNEVHMQALCLKN